MEYVTTKSEFSEIITTVKGNAKALNESVQSALFSALYLCLDNSGGTTPFQNVLDAVSTTAHRQGIVTWMEKFAPVRVVDNGTKILLHKDNWKKLDKEVALADFVRHLELIGATEENSQWWLIAKEKNTVVSVYNADNRVASLVKSLTEHGFGDMAFVINAAVDEYKKYAARAFEKPVIANTVEGEVVSQA